MTDTSTTIPADPPSFVAQQSSLLRLYLAVRDWADPRNFLKNLDHDSRRQVLNAVARDVDVDPQNRPGQWSLKKDVRRRVAVSRPHETLIESAEAAGNDPVATALLRLLRPAGPVDRLADDDDAALAAFQRVLNWLPETISSPGASDVEALKQQVDGMLAARRRTADSGRLAKQMIGQDPLIGQIEQLLLYPGTDASPFRPPVAFAWGLGGIGKSTLVARIESLARNSAPPFVVIHLDFDRARLNPSIDGSLDLAFLAQVGATDPDMGLQARTSLQELERTLARQHRQERAITASVVSSSRTRRSARAGTRLTKSTRTSQESAHADLRSPVAGTMEPFAAAGRPLLLVLDSIEAVEAMGLAAMRSLERWAAATGQLSGQPDMRILAAGRRPRVSPETDIAWFERWNGVVRDFEIDQLDTSERAQVLAARGMDDAQLRERAAEALPGNPLLLRLTAEEWKNEASDRDAIRDDLIKGKVPKAAADRYLEERLVRHMQDPAARPYVRPALAVPLLTRPIIAALLRPVVEESRIPPVVKRSRTSDEPEPKIETPPNKQTAVSQASISRQSRQIYAAFRTATWLTSERANGRELVLRPEVRQFALELAQEVPETAATLLQIHKAGAAWHEKRRSKQDQAFAFYHRAMLGLVHQPPAGSRDVFARILGSAVADLPEGARNAFTVATASAAILLENAVASPAVPYANLDDKEWSVFFEGKGDDQGLAGQLVEADNALEALSLYRQRPTRRGSLPPTQILRALAETGEPVDDLPPLISAELGRKIASDSAGVERLYWLVRIMCMASPDATSSVIPEFARNAVLHTVTTSKSNASHRARHKDLMDVLVIYLLLQNQRDLLLDVVRADTTIPSHRLALAALLIGHAPANASTKAEQVVVRQLPDWIVAGQEWSSVLVDAAKEYEVYRALLEKLQDERLSVMEDALSPFENRQVRLSLGNLSRGRGIQLLRGLTPEIHRPLRHALVQAWNQSENLSRGAIRSIISDTMRVMSVTPADFKEEVFWKRLSSDPAIWFGAFVTFADRARALPYLMDAILRASGGSSKDSKLVNVARMFERWDRALTKGAGSHFGGGV